MIGGWGYYSSPISAAGSCPRLDGIWLGLITQPFYQAQIGFLLVENPNWAAAGVFYLL